MSARPTHHPASRITLHVHVLGVLALIVLPLTLFADQRPSMRSQGVAWRVIGLWHTSGSEKVISDGDAISPESLLEPAGDEQHSITILLPDGQRILYECFARRDCARGFRVPPLYRLPEPMAVDLLARVGAAERRNPSTENEKQKQSDLPIPRDEAVAPLGSGNQVEVAGLLGRLSNGTYSYTVRSLSDPVKMQPAREFTKQGKTVTLTVPSAGLFEVLVIDQMKTPRIDLLLAAPRASGGAHIVKSFQDVEKLLKDWNEDYQGWPIHEFKRDYLRSAMLHIEPVVRANEAALQARTRPQTSDVACEPQFTPAPGVFKADLEVRLRCSTPGATVHYTVDGSQPLEGADVYRAPVVVKGTALTIKAFATATGKKDSPVVTGIFRIGD